MRDVASLIAEAKARAARASPGAWVDSINLDDVDSRGRLPDDGGWLAVEFRAPPAPPPAEGVGRAPAPCLVLMRDGRGWYDELRPCIHDGASRRWSPAPRCTVAAIWARAIADGASEALTAQIRFAPLGDPGGPLTTEAPDAQWVSVLAGSGQPFVRAYADDCVAP